MDYCQEFELNDLIEFIPYLDRNMWESARLNAFITAKAHFKGINEYKDVAPFKWEKESDDSEHVTEISDDDIKRLEELSKQWQKEQPTIVEKLPTSEIK